MTDVVEKKHPIAIFKEQFEVVLAEIPSSDDLPREKMFSAAVIAVTKTPDLLTADRGSLFQSIRQCAADGLAPDGREAHLQIYNTKVKNDTGGTDWVKMVSYNPMIWGITKRVLNSGKISGFWAEIICKGEEYSVVYENGMRQPRHIYDALNRSDKIIGAYAVAIYKTGMVELETMTEHDLQKIRASSKTDKVWGPWPDEKSKVAVMRRLAKRLPLASEDKGIIQGNDTDFAKIVAAFPNEAKRLALAPTYTERLAATTNGQGAKPMPEPQGDVKDVNQATAPLETAQASVLGDPDDEQSADVMSDEYTQGENCFKDEIPVADCPFEVDTQEGTNWLGGWYGAKIAAAGVAE